MEHKNKLMACFIQFMSKLEWGQSQPTNIVFDVSFSETRQAPRKIISSLEEISSFYKMLECIEFISQWSLSFEFELEFRVELRVRMKISILKDP